MQHSPMPRRALTAIYRVGFKVRGYFPRWHCYDSLRRDHVPLYSEDLQLAVLFSPKAGCTFAVKWFYFQTGILEEALAYSQWPHDYRLQVLYEQPGYRDKVTAVPALGARAVKFVRNPYDRAVSGYLHFAHLSQRPVPSGARAVVDDSQSIIWVGPSTMGPRSPSGNGSATLGAIDLDTANPHFRRQVSPCERVGRLPHMRIVKIEDTKAVMPGARGWISACRRATLTSCVDHHTTPRARTSPGSSATRASRTTASKRSPATRPSMTRTSQRR